MKNNISDVANAVGCMEDYLEEHLSNAPKKKWKNTYIYHQIEKRKDSGTFNVQDHIRGMVYAMISSGAPWERVEDGIELETGRILPLDEAFQNYDPNFLMQLNPTEMWDIVKNLKLTSQYTLKQLTALKPNIEKLLAWEAQYGSVDAYYQPFVQKDPSLKTLVRRLSDSNSPDKLRQMAEPLTAEYLKNVGYSIAKPDRHVRRILGSEALDLSDKTQASIYQTFDIVKEIADAMKKTAAEVDYILWSYCAKGYGEICTKRSPKCDRCAVKEYCRK